MKNWSLLSVKVDPSSDQCRFVGHRKNVEQAGISAILAKKIQRFPWEIAECVAQFSHISKRAVQNDRVVGQVGCIKRGGRTGSED
ncbi:MAG: hypothetical protein DME43_08670 [Verrucomicrobia bacterium]|nr:MAG: hypothetical protein DME43_08670 [Verrucomicrobiota bacterium]